MKRLHQRSGASNIHYPKKVVKDNDEYKVKGRMKLRDLFWKQKFNLDL